MPWGFDLQPIMIPVLTFFPGGCSEGLGALWFFFEQPLLPFSLCMESTYAVRSFVPDSGLKKNLNASRPSEHPPRAGFSTSAYVRKSKINQTTSHLCRISENMYWSDIIALVSDKNFNFRPHQNWSRGIRIVLFGKFDSEQRQKIQPDQVELL